MNDIFAMILERKADEEKQTKREFKFLCAEKERRELGFYNTEDYTILPHSFDLQRQLYRLVFKDVSWFYSVANREWDFYKSIYQSTIRRLDYL